MKYKNKTHNITRSQMYWCAVIGMITDSLGGALLVLFEYLNPQPGTIFIHWGWLSILVLGKRTKWDMSCIIKLTHHAISLDYAKCCILIGSYVSHVQSLWGEWYNIRLIDIWACSLCHHRFYYSHWNNTSLSKLVCGQHLGFTLLHTNNLSDLIIQLIRTIAN